MVKSMKDLSIASDDCPGTENVTPSGSGNEGNTVDRDNVTNDSSSGDIQSTRLASYQDEGRSNIVQYIQSRRRERKKGEESDCKGSAATSLPPVSPRFVWKGVTYMEKILTDLDFAQHHPLLGESLFFLSTNERVNALSGYYDSYLTYSIAISF
jgi:hypothetical protein